MKRCLPLRLCPINIILEGVDVLDHFWRQGEAIPFHHCDKTGQSPNRKLKSAEGKWKLKLAQFAEAENRPYILNNRKGFRKRISCMDGP